MSDDKPSLSEAIRLLAERDRRSLGAHPKIEDLAAYHEGELAPEAEAKLREHLAVCHECSDLLLDLINFADLTPPPGEPELTDEEMEADWKALRARMGEDKQGPKKAGGEVVPMIRPAPAAPAPSLGRTYPPWLTIAASILAVVGLPYGLYQNHRAGEALDQLEASRKPNVEDTFSLQSTTTRGGNEGVPEEPASMSSQKGGTILLSPPETGPIHVEIVQGDELLWDTGIEGDPIEISIDIPGGFLRPGSYKARVYGQVDGKRALVYEYPLEVGDP